MFNTTTFDSDENFWYKIDSVFHLRTDYIMNTLSFMMWCYQFCGNHWLLCLLLWGAEKPPLWVMWLCICGKRKRGGKKPNKTSPKPNIPFQWFYFGNGHKHTSYFSWLWLWWLPIMSASPLSAETSQKCKSQSQPSLTCPWDCGTWSSVTNFPYC